MGRILGIDAGQKRIGLAVTDPLRIIATGLDTVPVAEVFRYLSDYTKKQKVDFFVVGYPLNMDNVSSDASRYIEPFINKLTETFPEIPVYRADERFTSSMAKQAMIDGGLRKMARRNKAVVDKISAVIMLQSFLDKNKILK